MSTMLLAATGLGVDTSHVVYDNSRVQHSADAAALAIAVECAQAKATCSKAGADGVASDLVDANSGGDSGSIVASTLKPSDGTVTTHAAKTVDTHFFGAFGIETKNVDGNATAVWSKHATAGDVIPFAVTLCEYAKHTLNSPTTIRTDVNDVLGNTIVTKNNQSLTSAYANMAPFLETCNVPAGIELVGSPSSVTMLPGGLWMSSHGSSTNNGNLIPTKVLESLESVDGWNVNQQDKFSKYLSPGKVIPIAIYAPTGNFAHGGLRTSGSNAAWKGTVDLDIVGYAPFQVSGWCFSSKCYGASPGANRLGGKFISTAAPFEDFEYGTEGGTFGALLVELTE